MGSTRKIKYIVEVVVPGFYSTLMEWKVKGQHGYRGYGTPSTTNLAEFVRASNEAVEPGGINSHLGAAHKIVSAKIWLNNGRHDTLLAQV